MVREVERIDGAYGARCGAGRRCVCVVRVMVHGAVYGAATGYA